MSPLSTHFHVYINVGLYLCRRSVGREMVERISITDLLPDSRTSYVNNATPAACPLLVITFLLEVKLPYEPVCQADGMSVSQSFGWMGGLP